MTEIYRHCLRWIPLAGIGALLFLLARHVSVERQIFSRYSPQLFLLMIAVGTWGLTWLWIVLQRRRLERFLERLRTIPAAIVLVLVNMLILFDLSTDMASDLMRQAVSATGILTCFFIALVALLMSAENPRAKGVNAALATTSLVLCFFVAEITFRVLFVETSPFHAKGFETWISATWPRPIAVENTSGALRILGLGDSFGENGGLGNYHYALENLLVEDGCRCEVVNLSVDGFQLPDELKIFRERGVLYQPGLVLHSFFVGNDFGVFSGASKRYRNIPLTTRHGAGAFRPRHFLLAEWFGKYLEAAASTDADFSASFSEDVFLAIEKKRLERISRIHPERPEGRWQETLRMIDLIREEARRIGAEYVMVIHPDQFQVESALYSELTRHFNLNPSSYDAELPQSFLMDYCASRRVRCLSLLSDFKEHGSGGGLYLPRNTHYNDAGNRLAADRIHRFLGDEGLIPHR